MSRDEPSDASSAGSTNTARPPPPTFRQSSSPYMRSLSPTPSTSSQLASKPNGSSPSAPSWSRPPQQGFNPRTGGVQLGATPKSFLPSLGRPRPTANGGPPQVPLKSAQQQLGQQAYVRAAPTSLPSGALGGGRRAASAGTGGPTLVSFPSAFGVRQTVSVRRASDVSNSNAGSPIESTFGIRTRQAEGIRSGSSERERERDQAVEEEEEDHSVLATMMVAGDAEVHTASPVAVEERSMETREPPLALVIDEAHLSPIMSEDPPSFSTTTSSPPQPPSPMMYELPHPHSPDASSLSPVLPSTFSRFDSDSSSTSAPSISTSTMSHSLPNSPDIIQSGFDAPRNHHRGQSNLSTTSSTPSSHPSIAPSIPPLPSIAALIPKSTSVLNRPRPRTPDSSTTLSNASTYDPYSTSSLRYVSERTIESSFGSSSLLTSTKVKEEPRSEGAPMLELDLGMGGAESMFDLASLLRVGSGETASKRTSVVPPAIVVPVEAKESEVQVAEQDHGEKASSPRTVTRKQPPKLDDEQDRSSDSMASCQPLGDRRRGSSTSLLSFDGSRPQRRDAGSQSPVSHRSTTPLPTELPRSTSPGPGAFFRRVISSSNLSSSGHGTLGDEEPRRRRSVVSLLSLKSGSNGDHRTMAAAQSTDSLAAPTSPKRPKVPHSLSLSSLSSLLLGSSIDKSLPPTPHSPSTSFDKSPIVTPPTEDPRRPFSKLRTKSENGFSFISSKSRHKAQASTSSVVSERPSTPLGRLFGSKSGAGSALVESPGNEEMDPMDAVPRRASGASVLGASAALGLGMGIGGMRSKKSEDGLMGRYDDATIEEEREGQGRQSMDGLARERGITRKSSTDNLLNLAASQLSKLGIGKQRKTSSTRSESTGSRKTSQDLQRLPLDSNPVPLDTRDSFEDFHHPTTIAPTRFDRSEPQVFVSPPPASFDRAPLPASQTAEVPRDLGQAIVLSAPPRKRSKIPDSGQGSDASMSSAWLTLEDSLDSYAEGVEQDSPNRANIIIDILLPFLRSEGDRPCSSSIESLAKRQRKVLFGWLTVLTNELHEMQPSHRGVCLESIAAIAESHLLSEDALARDENGQAEYRSAIVSILAFAVDKLNEKAVYANTLVFSGRIFALAFFRVEGVAFKLLRALPAVKKQALNRILDEAGIDPNHLPPVDLSLFPSHLAHLCLTDFKAYVRLLLPFGPQPHTEDDQYLVRDGVNIVEMSGNWLIRWTASDSDLPFAFYRAYHRQLSSHLSESSDLSPKPSPYTSPGFLFLSASLLDKLDALVHRNLRSVTSISPNSSTFNSNDSATPSYGQKPKVLELANRRLVSTMLDIVGGPPLAPIDAEDAAPDAEMRRYAFGGILQVWIRACVKKTSLWDTRSVFILLDLVEAIVYALAYPAPSTRMEEEGSVVVPQESCLEMFDIPFILSFVKIILEVADSTIAIMRTVAFVYAHFEIFTLRVEDRNEVCENILLDKSLFPRLYLHWNAGVRGYFIRILVWRLARLGIVAAERHPSSTPDPRILDLFGLMNLRLEAIRKRHDELEPIDNLTDDDLYRPNPKRMTICSTRGVKEAPFAVDELVGTFDEESGEEEEQPQEPVKTLAVPVMATKGTGRKEVTVAKVVSWLKVGLRKGRQNKSRPSAPDIRVESFADRSIPFPRQSAESLRSMSSSSDVFQDHSWTSTFADSDVGSISDTLTTTAELPHRPASPAFFSFEFEGGLLPRSDIDATSSSPSSDLSTPTPIPSPSARVSLRFSKRISILPPAALSLLQESGEPVPPIPAQYRATTPDAYAASLHPYAIRGLRDYETALDEWTEFISRLQEEEDEGGKMINRGFVDTVPRLAVAWGFEDAA